MGSVMMGLGPFSPQGERKYTATAEVKFEAAHRLYKYNGKCRQTHGHNYKLEVEVSNSFLGTSKHTPPGMVIDFKVLKRILHEEIISTFDHTLILAGKDPLAKFLFHYGETLKVMVLPEKYPDATAECLCEYFAELLDRSGCFKKYSVHLKRIKIQETDEFYAEMYF